MVWVLEKLIEKNKIMSIHFWLNIIILGDIICNLTTDVTDIETIEGTIVTPNLKSEFDGCKKVILISSQQLDEVQPYNYEEFKFCIKKWFRSLTLNYQNWFLGTFNI